MASAASRSAATASSTATPARNATTATSFPATTAPPSASSRAAATARPKPARAATMATGSTATAATPSASPKSARSRLDHFAELDAAGDLVRGEVARAMVDDLLGAALLLHDDARDDHGAGHRVGDDGGLGGLDLGERLEAALDLAECDALDIDLDDVVLAAGELEAAVLVDAAEVAGAQPARLVDRADRDHAGGTRGRALF